MFLTATLKESPDDKFQIQAPILTENTIRRISTLASHDLVNWVAREEGLDVPNLMQLVILLLSNVDDVAIFLYDYDGMSCFLGAIQAFCQSSRLNVNVDKIKIMVIQTIAFRI